MPTEVRSTVPCCFTDDVVAAVGYSLPSAGAAAEPDSEHPPCRCTRCRACARSTARRAGAATASNRTTANTARRRCDGGRRNSCCRRRCFDSCGCRRAASGGRRCLFSRLMIMMNRRGSSALSSLCARRCNVEIRLLLSISVCGPFVARCRLLCLAYTVAFARG